MPVISVITCVTFLAAIKMPLAVNIHWPVPLLAAISFWIRYSVACDFRQKECRFRRSQRLQLGDCRVD